MRTALFAVLCTVPACAGTWTFPTGPAELGKGGGISFPMDDAAYQRFVEQTKASGRTVAVQKKPAGLSPKARYGYNFVVGGKNRGWILDGDDEQGWVLYLDWKGDGDLTGAKPLRLQPVDGRPELRVEVEEGDLRWPIRFAVRHIDVEGKAQLGVEIGDGTVRKGVIELEGKRFLFRLAGSRGKYNGQYDTVSVDRFGSGEYDRYKVPDRHLNLGGKSYEFTVDPLGASLTLTELAETIDERPSLKPGSVAPTFVTKDIGAAEQKLEAYRGRMLLLEFWSTSCGPCRAEAPRLVDFFKQIPRDKVSFLGVSSDESEPTLRKFLTEFAIEWPQIREPFEGPLHQLYRVSGEPTYYLMGQGGEILDGWMGSGETIGRVKKFLAAK